MIPRYKAQKKIKGLPILKY